MDDFTELLEQYIYNTVTIADTTLDLYKGQITQRIFEYICDYNNYANLSTNSNSESNDAAISFQDFMDSLTKLTQSEFVHIINGTPFHRRQRSPSMQSMNSLHSIDEH